MANVRFTTELKGSFEKAFKEKYGPIADAATAAVREATNAAKLESRANIAGAGFGPKWQNALRGEVFPGGNKTSVNAAGLIFHKIGYSLVFEEGRTIHGAPLLLWLPLRNVPKSRRGNRPMRPEEFKTSIGPLASARGASKPLLIGKIRGGKPEPMYIGIESVRIPKKFNVIEIVKRAASQLPRLYYKHFKDK